MFRKVKEFFIPGEKKLFDEIDKSLSLSGTAVSLLVKALSQNSKGYDVIQEYNREISRLEQEGDEITRKLEEAISEGNISAPLIGDFKRLVETVDSILDRTHALSRDILRNTRYYSSSKNEIHSYIYSRLQELLIIGINAIKMLRELIEVSAVDPKKGKKIAAQIEELEEKGDDTKDEMRDEIYSSAPKIDFWIFYHLIVTTIQSDDILDLCEDASDLISTILTTIGV